MDISQVNADQKEVKKSPEIQRPGVLIAHEYA